MTASTMAKTLAYSGYASDFATDGVGATPAGWTFTGSHTNAARQVTQSTNIGTSATATTFLGVNSRSSLNQTWSYALGSISDVDTNDAAQALAFDLNIGVSEHSITQSKFLVITISDSTGSGSDVNHLVSFNPSATTDATYSLYGRTDVFGASAFDSDPGLYDVDFAVNLKDAGYTSASTIEIDFTSTSGTGGLSNTNPATYFLTSVSFSSVPEPSSLALIGLGGLSLAVRRRR